MEEVKYDFTVRTSRRNLYLAVLIAYLGPVATGFVLGWSSPSLVLLEAPDSEFPVTERQGAWLASLFPLGSVFGPFVSGWLLDSVGRRQTILLYLLMILAGWGLMSTWSIWLMYIGRMLAGIAYGISIAVTSIYIGEISENSVRAMLNTMFPIFSRTPLLISYSLGPHISYHAFIFLSCLPIILFLLMYNKLPETPHFLLLKNREDEATKALLWLRQLPEALVFKEINEIKESLSKKKKGTWKELFTKRGNVRAVVILSSLRTFWQASGGSTVFLYAQIIFQLTNISLRSDLCASVLAVVLIVGSLLSPPIVRHWGYKRPLIASTLGSATSMGCFAYLTYLCENGNDSIFVQWAVLLSLATYIIVCSCGLSSISMSLIGEYFPSHLKAKGSTVATFSFCIAAFLSTNLFPDAVSSFGLSRTCWFSCGLLVVATIFEILVVPETSGLSFDEIQDILNK